MPLYEYECDACGRRFELIQKFSDPAPDVCKECGKGPVHRLLSSPAIQFKGSGFYITDYAQKGKSDSSPATPPGKPGDGAKADTASSESGAAKTDTARSETTKSDTASTSKSKE